MQRLAVWIVGALALQGCAAEFGLGYHFPEGSAARGRDAFVALGCQSCHRLDGVYPPLVTDPPGPIGLGGDTGRVKTYGDLVTSIVNPSHRISKAYPAEEVSVDGDSLMSRVYLNEIMTVQELVDLVALLQSAYEVIPPPVRYWEIYPSEDPDAPFGGLRPD